MNKAQRRQKGDRKKTTALDMVAIPDVENSPKNKCEEEKSLLELKEKLEAILEREFSEA